jgi:xanthine dehydrogenase YagR molybdenum-binding subunit
VIPRDGRLFRRDDENRSESYADILVRAGLAEIEGRGKSAADPVAQSSYAMLSHAHVATPIEPDGPSAVSGAGRRWCGVKMEWQRASRLEW